MHWLAPLHLLLLDPGCKPQIAGMTASQMRPLLEVAAACAFWDLPESFITKVMADVGLDTSGTLLSKMQRLIRNTLGGSISEEELCSILMQRLAVLEKPADDWMAQDDLRAELDDADAQEVESFQSRKEEQQQKHATYRREFHALHQRLHPPRPVPGGRGRGRGGEGGPSNTARLAVGTLPDEGLTQSMASPLVPAAAAIHKDTFNGRWRLTCRAPYSDVLSGISRSWGCHGDKVALIMVLRFAWDQWCDLTGNSCPIHDL